MINKLYPGLPDYVGPKSGFFTLLHHHGPPIEWSHDVMERVKYIQKDKAAHERPIRLRHIVYVPKKMIPKPVQKAYAKWQKAYAKWQKARAELEKAYAKWQKARAELEKAYAKWQKARAELEKAYAKWHSARAE